MSILTLRGAQRFLRLEMTSSPSRGGFPAPTPHDFIEGSEIDSCFPFREELRSLTRGDFFRHRRSYKLIDARLVLFAQPLHCLFE